jgi:hypothetical protein
VKPYQVLALIGCMIGIILIPISIFFYVDVSSATSTAGSFTVRTAFALFLYIIAIAIAFISKKTRAVGITLIVISVLALLFAEVWGIVPFVLLLAAGIKAVRYK